MEKRTCCLKYDIEILFPFLLPMLLHFLWQKIHGSGSVKIVGNNLGGSVKLDDLTMSLKWSHIGNLRMYLIQVLVILVFNQINVLSCIWLSKKSDVFFYLLQPVMWTLVKTVVIPYANSYLGKGFPLPIIHGFTLQNAEIMFSSSKVTVCSDVAYSESDNLNQLSNPVWIDYLFILCNLEMSRK